MSKAKNPRVYGFFVVLLAIALFVPALAPGGMRGATLTEMGMLTEMT